ncbi:hypothetical protein SPYJRS4_0026 [Streptococcus pyogenes JRS4]|nr:hypothetical protein MGAS10270_Spy0024 [Streptococcus pyogenes MGAS10270]BAR43526.1 hypothetical protein SPYJRS4_0026 [Streptococcus pyogenes JRS4]
MYLFLSSFDDFLNFGSIVTNANIKIENLSSYFQANH